jgi:perosamine synthetase
MKAMPPMVVPFLKAVYPPNLEDQLASVFSSGYVGSGPRVEEFEKRLAQYLGTSRIVCTSSCTAALFLSYVECGIAAGDEVLSTPMTCTATNIPLLHLGARIKWIDVDPLTGNVTAQAVNRALQANPAAKFVVIVDWAGLPCDYEGIQAVTSAYGKPLVLDAAQSFGSRYEGRLFPPRVDFTCYSFGPTKILSAGEGGAVIALNERTEASLRSLRWYGIDREDRDPIHFWDYDVTYPGYRFTSNDVFASVGIRCLDFINERISINRRLAKIYQERLSGKSGLRLPPLHLGVESNYWMFTVLVERRTSFLNRLHSYGIHAATPHKRNDRLTCFSHSQDDTLLGVEAFNDNYACLPIGPWVSEEKCAWICNIINQGW